VISRAYRAWARVVARRPGAVILAGFLVVALAAWAAATQLEFKTARIELVGDTPFTRRHLALEEEFGDLNAMVVAVRAEDPAQVRACLGALERAVAADREHFRGAFVRVDPSRLGGRSLLFSPTSSLATIDSKLILLGPELARGGVVGALNAFAKEIEERLQAPEEGSALGGRALLGLGERVLVDVEGALSGQAPTRDPLGELPGWDTSGYTFTSDGCGIALISYVEAEGSLDPRTSAVGALRQILADLRGQFPQVLELGLTGKPVLEVDEMKTYERDSIRSSLAALIAVTLLLVLAFRRLLGPFLIGLCLLLAVTSTLGLAVLWPGHLNLMAVVFVVVVIGLGVDFGIHLVARYDEERSRGSAPPDALEEACGRTGPAILAGGLTTAGAFAVAVFTEFKGLREFGAIASFGVLASLLVMGSVLPALVLLLDRWRSQSPPPPPGQFLRGWERGLQRRPRLALGVVGLLTLIAVGLAPQVRFNGDLLAMQDPGLDSVRWERRLFDDAQLSGWFLAYPSQDLEHLAEVAERVRALPGVDRVESVLDVLPREQAARLPQVQRVQGRLRTLLAAREAPATAASWRAAVERLRDALEEAAGAALEGGRSEAAASLDELLARVEALEEACPASGQLPASALAYDARLQGALRGRLAPLADPPAELLSPRRLPPALRARLLGERGSALLRIYPRGNLWNPNELESFLDEVRGELPEVTGVPVLLHESSRLMQRGYRQAGWLALVVVAICIVLTFRRPLPAALALLTLAVGALWFVGAMVALGLELNPANLVALPLLIGIGIDTAVHVIHRGQELQAGEPLVATSLGRALIYSGLTSVASFGSLMLGDHPGTASIGSTISLGVACCLLAGLTVPTAALALRREA
jgi:uncharacterized protein